jgi:hypothetical protein
MDPATWAQYGLAGLVAGATISLARWALDRGWANLERQQELTAGDGEAHPDGLNRLQCQVDPLHFQHATAVHDAVMDWDDKINRGDFSCAWRDRDEIRDVLELLKSQAGRQEDAVVATRELTTEVRALALEMRTTRNGGAK